MNPRLKLLIIDDNEDFGFIVSKIARGLGYEAFATASSAAFRQAFKALQPDIIVIDILMPECDGIEQITWLSAQKCHPRVFLVSGGDPFYLTMTKSIGEALGQLCITVIEKPLDIIVFRNHLKAVQAAYRIHSPVLTGGHD